MKFDFENRDKNQDCLDKWQAVQNFYVKNNKNFLSFEALTPENAIKAAWELEGQSRLLMRKNNEEILTTLEQLAEKLFAELCVH